MAFREAFHVDRLGPAPTGTREHPDVGVTLEDWTIGAARYFGTDAEVVRSELVPVLHAMVTKMMVAGHGQTRAQKVAEFVFPTIDSPKIVR